MNELWGTRDVTLKKTQNALARCFFAWRKWEDEKQKVKSQGGQQFGTVDLQEGRERSRGG